MSAWAVTMGAGVTMGSCMRHLPFHAGGGRGPKSITWTPAMAKHNCRVVDRGDELVLHLDDAVGDLRTRRVQKTEHDGTALGRCKATEMPDVVAITPASQKPPRGGMHLTQCRQRGQADQANVPELVEEREERLRRFPVRRRLELL